MADRELSKWIVEEWERPDYRGFILLQMALALLGVQSVSKSSEVANINIHDAYQLQTMLKQMIKEE